jgi:hypothetical protein
MRNRCWYVVDALMADLTSHQRKFVTASEEDAQRKMREHYPGMVAVLMLENPTTGPRPAAFERGWKWSEHTKSRSSSRWMWSEKVRPRAQPRLAAEKK